MALTKIRGSQIQDHSIGNAHIDPTSPIVYSNLDLSQSIVATDLSTNHTVHTDVLDYKLVALWDLVQNLAVSGASTVVTSQVQAAAVTDTATNDGSAKGVLTTGTGTNGAGIENYKIQLRDAITKDAITDNIGGSAYGELTYNGSAYTLSFKKSDGSSFTMGAQEQAEITVDPNTNNILHGKWFLIASPTTKYRIILNYVGDPALDALAGYVDVNATIANNDDAATVATAIRGALNGISGGAVFTATGSAASVVVTTVAGVVIHGISDGSGLYETDFIFATLSKGTPSSIDFMFEEIYSLNSAPLKGFVTGTGFTDVVTVTGTHNHNDLYYSKSELESGQLDDRYYTQGELNAGQLDGRYFTESELTNGQLDGRYYTETELGSTVEGSSGASKIGISGVTGLAAGTVQSALAELQGDIDSIVSGGIDITHSLDDAYDDGSAIAVDNTDVLWNISAGRSFKIADSTDVSKLIVKAGTAVDSVKIDTTGGIDIDAKNGISISEDSGSYLYLGPIGQTVLSGGTSSATMVRNTDSGDVSIAAASGRVLLSNSDNTTAQSISISSDTGGVDVQGVGISLTSTNALNLKDANLTASLPLSQSGVSALSTNLTATSIVGAINENADDLHTLVATTLPSTTDGSSGADGIGVTGITGVIPTGGTAGSNGTVQTMLEGIAMGAGGGKTFADIGAFTTAKSGGTYFKLNEPVFILDTNRWVIVEQQGTGIIEDTDWGYVAGTNRVIGGADFVVSTTGSATLSSADAEMSGTTTLILDGPNGSQLSMINGGDTSILSANGKKASVSSDTEVELNGGALVDINGTSVTIDGALTATGAANDMMTVTSSGLGETRLVSALEIDLTGGDIDINAGTGKVVTVDSDTKITATSAGEIELNGGTVDINAGTGLPITLDSDTLVALTGGAEVDLTATTIDLNGSIDMDGASASFTTTGSFSINAVDAVYIATDASFIVHNRTEGGPEFSVDTQNSTIWASAGNDSRINLYYQDMLGIVDIDGDFIDMNGTDIGLTGKITATNTADQNMTLTTTGSGQIVLASETELNVNAPYTSIAGDVTMPVDAWLSVGNIKVTSVDPTDEATISGSRSGTVNVLNKLVNSGFELGSGNDATNWTEDSSIVRTNINRYYGSYSMRYQRDTFVETPVTLLTQAVTGLTVDTAHTASLYLFGTVVGGISAKLGSGVAVTIVPAGTYPTWQRFSVTLGEDNPEDADFKLILANTMGGENFYIDAVMLEEGSTANDYFSDYKSELVFTIGDEDYDRIVFRSSGTSTSDLVRINQSTVEILGNLLVSGTTTTVNSEDMLVADNQIVLNSNVTGAPSLDAYFKVERGTEADTAIRWNEATDKWELSTDGTTYSAIVTASGTSGLSMDSAYDGGSSVTVDDTNVNFALAASKSFLISDGTDANKFVVSAGSGADSVKIDTTGGVDIDTNGGFIVNDDAGASIQLTNDGFAMMLSNSVAQIAALTNSVDVTTTNITLLAQTSTVDNAVKLSALAGGVDINAAADKPITLDSGSFSIDGVLASNVSTTAADLTLSTITSGNLVLTGADAIIAGADSIDIAANSDGIIEIRTTGTGETQISSEQEIDLTGGAIDINAGLGQSVTIDSGTSVVINGGVLTQLDATVIDVNGQFDFDGELFDVNVTGTGVSALKMVSAGGIDIDTANGFALNDDSGTHLTINSDGLVDLQSVDGLILSAVNGNASLNASGSGTVGIYGMNSTAVGSIEIHTVNGGIDINASATKPVTIDTGSFSIDGVLASNVTVTGGNLDIQTITSGNLTLTSAGELVFSDSRLAGIEFTDALNTALPGTATSIVGALNELWTASQGANTLDEVYDGETGTRVVTMDNGSINFRVTDTYAFAVQDSAASNIISAQASATGDKVEIDANLDVAGPTAEFALTGAGASSFKVDTVGGIDLDTDEGFALNDDSGALFTMSSAGAIALTAAAGQTLGLTTSGAGNASITSGAKITLTSGSTATDSIKLASGGGVDIAAASDSTVAISTSGTGLVTLASTTEIDLTGGTIDINGGTDKNITLDAIGTGKVLLTSADAINLTAGATSEIKATAGNLTVHATGAGGELYLGDVRTGDIKWSDATNTSLPGGATSLMAALKAAYDNKGTEVARAYHEVTANTTDVSNDYVVTNIALLPTTGTFPMSPTALRTLSDQVHVVVYLNGLRLSDTEWRYSYDDGTSERRVTFDGSNNITLVPGDLIMIDVEKISTVTA